MPFFIIQEIWFYIPYGKEQLEGNLISNSFEKLREFLKS